MITKATGYVTDPTDPYDVITNDQEWVLINNPASYDAWVKHDKLNTRDKRYRVANKLKLYFKEIHNIELTIKYVADKEDFHIQLFSEISEEY